MWLKNLWELFITSTLLGLTSFGGPVAHLGYFHKTYVEKKKWLDEAHYADLVALAQFLPGPASSQVGMGIGYLRSGLIGAIVAWIGFTVPSAVALVLFAFFVKAVDVSQAGWLVGLRVVAVVVVFHAVMGMGKKLVTSKVTATIAVAATGLTLLWPTPWTQVVVILAAGLVGYVLFRKEVQGGQMVEGAADGSSAKQLAMGLGCLVLFGVGLVGLPLWAGFTESVLVKLAAIFYSSGALVFGGGHVILPLLQMDLVPTGFLTDADFLAGFGATQAVPGPLFTFSAYLGAVIGGIPAAVVSLLAVFLPSFLLIVGVLPFWNKLRVNGVVRAALVGVNAAVVGILIAALYNPLWVKAITHTNHFVLAMVLFLGMAYWKMPTWLIVGAGILMGAVWL